MKEIEKPVMVANMPKALEIEKDLLNALLMESPYIHDVTQLLDEEAFYDIGYRNIYKAIVSLYKRQEQVFLGTVHEELKRTLGNAEYYLNLLLDVIKERAYDESVMRMALILDDYRRRRALMALGERMKTLSIDMTMPIAEGVEMLRRQLEAILEGRITTMTTLGEERAKVMQRIADNRQGTTAPPGLLCGIPQLDAEGGLCEEGLVVIGGKSSHGKTMMLDMMALNVARQGKYVAFFSLEMSREKVATRVLAMQSLVDNSRLRRKPLNDEEMQRVMEADLTLQEAADSHLLFESAPSFEQMMTAIRALHYKYHLAMVVVDYLQLLNITAETKADTAARILGKAAHEMHDLGLNLHLTIAATSQINRSYVGEPNGGALRDSGEIYEAADQVIVVWSGAKEVPPLENYPSHYRLHGQVVPTQGHTLVKVEKNRDGDTSYFFMGFIPQFTLLCSVEERERLMAMCGNSGITEAGNSGNTESGSHGNTGQGQMELDLPF